MAAAMSRRGGYPIGARVRLLDPDSNDFEDGALGTVLGPPDSSGWQAVVLDAQPYSGPWFFAPHELRDAPRPAPNGPYLPSGEETR